MEVLEHDGGRLALYPDAPDWDGPTMSVARIRFPNADIGVQLLNEACQAARKAKASAILGPMEGDTWHSYRLVSESDGRAPFLMEPTSGPEDLLAFEAAGFRPVGRYFSASVPLEQIAAAPAQPLQTDLTIESWNGENPEALFAEVHKLSCAAFAKNAFYKAIALEEFLAMYMPMVPLLKRDLIFFARDGAGHLKGFLFGVPNYAEGPDPKAAILKTYASLHKGAGYALSQAFYRAASSAGYETAIHALIHEENLSALRSATNGAEVFRRYALMGRRLD